MTPEYKVYCKKLFHLETFLISNFLFHKLAANMLDSVYIKFNIRKYFLPHIHCEFTYIVLCYENIGLYIIF